MHRPLLAILLSALLAGSLAGCGPGFHLVSPRVDQDLAEALSERIYPDEAERGEPLDMLITTRGNMLTIHNRTPRAYEDVEVWLNREHVHAFDRIEIGTNRRLRLADFINEYGEPFPTAGFFTPDAGQRLVLAELYNPDSGRRHHLLVELEEE